LYFVGFLDLFRKKKEEKPVEIKKVSFEELTSWIELEAQTLAKDKEVFTNAVKFRIDQLVDELERGIEGLNSIDWGKIKTEERIKNIVMENLEYYIVQLEQLKIDLGNLEEMERTKIDNLFINFDKRTGKSYQKATFLIGKEIATINESVRNLFRDLDKLQEENKALLERIKVIFGVKKTLKELENTQSLISEVDNEIKRTDSKVEALQLKIKESNNQIKKIKESKDFQEWQAKHKHYTNTKHKRDSMIAELRRMIDFKSLAKVWHENKTEMKIIKKYREKFEKAFDEDKGEVLKELVTSLDNKDLINKKMQEILDLEKEVKEIMLEKSLTSNLEEDIKRVQNEIESLNTEKIREAKKIEKLVIKKEKIREVVSDPLREIRIEVT